ncbi:FAD-dependent monooxygenase [Leifsonia poae]|uniref:FAD-dependent monooxygenase n=1 Tax=Leifsonia poae TaxID=110933 RepID=UPI001CBB3CED|nr:FAD-dependent monooxygenase [Leifsonia poae]
MTDADAPVLILGGGPVGLAMALELAFHGVACMLVEPRREVEHSRPRAKTTSARSMELFRRTGAAAEIRRRAPIPVSWSDEVRFCTTPAGEDIVRLTGVLGLDLAGSELTSEPGQQVTQAIVEESLRHLIEHEALVDARFGSTGMSVDTSGDRPRVEIADANGVTTTVSCDYLVGADGARSVVRHAIGAAYVGAVGGRPNVNITFRSSGLAGVLPARPAVHHWALNPAAPGVVGPLDLDGKWWAIATGTESIADADEAARVVRNLVGADVDVEVIATDPWQARMLLSDSYGRKRAFLIGDAAHQNPPWGGHGFNTGVGDAVNLAWKLAAVLRGWAPAELLDSYEDERRPVAQQTIDLAATNMKALSIDLGSTGLMAAGEVGRQARTAAAMEIEQAKRAEFYALGLVLGYGYGETSALQSPGTDVYVPRAEPGNRLPHQRDVHGNSLFDILGPEFTVLGEHTDAWAREAAGRRLPLRSVDPVRQGFAPVAGDLLVLVRPDQHIAWVGPENTDPAAVLDHALRGFRTTREESDPSCESATSTTASSSSTATAPSTSSGQAKEPSPPSRRASSRDGGS